MEYNKLQDGYTKYIYLKIIQTRYLRRKAGIHMMPQFFEASDP